MTKFMTYDDVAERLGVSRTTVTRLVERGDLAVVQVSERSPRIEEADVLAFIAARKSTNNQRSAR